MQIERYKSPYTLNLSSCIFAILVAVPAWYKSRNRHQEAGTCASTDNPTIFIKFEQNMMLSFNDVSLMSVFDWCNHTDSWMPRGLMQQQPVQATIMFAGQRRSSSC